MSMEWNVVRLCDILRERRHMSCTEIGETLFADKHRCPRNRQCYALPAGKLVHAAIRRGLVKKAWESVTGYKCTGHAPRYCLVNADPDRTSDKASSVEGMVGKLVEMGNLRDGNGDEVIGILIECSKHDLQACDLRMYGDVRISNIVLSDTLQNLPTENNTERKAE